MEKKEELDTKDFDFTFGQSKENFAVVLKNCKKELNTEDKKFCVKIKSEPLEYGNDNNTEINTYENSRNNTNSFNHLNNSGYTSEIDIKKEEVKENYDIKYGIKSECKVVLKKLKFEVKREDCKEVVHLPDEKLNIKREPISTKNTNGSTIWTHSDYKIEKGKRLNAFNTMKVFVVIRIIQCKVVLKKLKIEVKTEDRKEVVHLPDDDGNVLPVNNEYFTSNENFIKNEMNIKIEEEEEIKKYDIQRNSEIIKQFKCNFKTKSYVTCSRKWNKIHGKIKRKYFKFTFSSHSKQQFTCELCKQTFTNKRILETHLFCHIKKKPFCCTTCNERFLWQFLLRRHMKEHQTGNKNEISHMNLRLQPSGNRVKTSRRNGKNFNLQMKNDICGKRVRYGKSRLEKHERIYKVHACKICGKEFKWKRYFLRHKARHSEDRPIKSDICNKNSKRKKKLKRHKKTYTEERPFKCDICNKGFNQKTHLKRHHLTHSEERTFKCDICNKGFKWKGQLKSHHLTHSEERLFKCDICNRGFNQKVHLESHHLTHSEERPFKCDICNKGFNLKGQLKSHYLTHSEERPFKCDICNRGFNRKETLKSHQVTHSKECFFKCDICNMSFKWKMQVKRHYETHTD
ncbi:oocyte zinc finger protein XlCOF6-like [Centruroides sculpturatus]|uniref:oocyte zinc finger protein XlCOF6-like n=1 Tax=Centruroides sculpturatus TaxID=218467 RepID=UPI000C6EEE41|nr:oocyte zinc finger protein XlCOF6-like [Centruroides sculpturatus]